MAIPIQGIPTLYGEVGHRLMLELAENERLYDEMPHKDMESDPDYQMMLRIVKKAQSKGIPISL